MWQYALALLLVGLFALAVGRQPARINAGVIAINFCANELWVRLTGQHDAWLIFTMTDTAAILVLTLAPAGRLGGLMAATYATQLIIHCSYVISPDPSPYEYWRSLTAMAWFQLALLFGAAGADGAARLRGLLRPAEPAHAEDNPGAVTRERGEEP